MYKNSVFRKTLLALAATASLFAALPSQAYDRHDSPQQYGHDWHDRDRQDRWDDRRDDDRHERRWDASWDRRSGYDHRRDDWRGGDDDRGEHHHFWRWWH